MNEIIKELKGVERTKFFKAVLEKVNKEYDMNNIINRNVNRVGNTIHRNKYLNKGTQYVLESKPTSNKINLRRIRNRTENYVVKRMKFVKRKTEESLKNRNCKCLKNIDRRSKKTTGSHSFTGLKKSNNRFCDDEKRKLKELYETNLRIPLSEIAEIPELENVSNSNSNSNSKRVREITPEEIKNTEKSFDTDKEQTDQDKSFNSNLQYADISTTIVEKTNSNIFVNVDQAANKEDSEKNPNQNVNDDVSKNKENNLSSTENVICSRSTNLQMQRKIFNSTDQNKSESKIKNIDSQTLSVQSNNILNCRTRMCRRNKPLRRRMVGL